MSDKIEIFINKYDLSKKACDERWNNMNFIGYKDVLGDSNGEATQASIEEVPSFDEIFSDVSYTIALALDA